MTLESFDPQLPFKIELDDVPAPESRRPLAGQVPLTPEVPVPGLPVPMPAEPEEEAPRVPSSWGTVKTVVARGFFDPFEAFEQRVDPERFRRSQGFLVLISLVGPMLATLALGFLAAVIYQIMAAFHSVTPANPFYELALYPVVYVFVKRYWIAYLVLPSLVLLIGWLWALGTAWNLARDSEEDFHKMFCILAMLGAMLAPFTMFPLLRLLALGVLIWYVSRRMGRYFEISFFHLVKRGGILLLILIAGYTWCERKVESYYPERSELNANLTAFYSKNQKLQWPAYGVQKVVSPIQALWDDLGSFDETVRNRSTASALAIMKHAGTAPQDRLRLAVRLAELGNAESMRFAAQAYQSGLGTPVDGGKALAWIHKAVEANPASLDLAMEEAALCFKNQRVLEGKRLFVALAKEHLDALNQITAYMAANGCGTADTKLSWEVQNLYRQEGNQAMLNARSNGGPYGQNQYGYGNGYGYARPFEGPSRRDLLLERISKVNRDNTQWFFNALVSEYGTTTLAEASVYGEAAQDTTTDELLAKIGAEDTAALAEAGDRLAEKGEVVKAREYWLKASQSLTTDKRRPNARLYLCLAESHDAGLRATPAALPREASRYYLGYLLLTEESQVARTKALAALKRLGVLVAPDVDVNGTPFLTLCTKYDVPEAWVMMGCNYMGDTLTHTPKNLVKARECFQKATALGYKGPAVHMLEGSASAPASGPRPGKAS